jgi:hypothetical protein
VQSFGSDPITMARALPVTLEPKAQLMGVLEALNGWLPFGLTTAFPFSIVEKVWSPRRGRHGC